MPQSISSPTRIKGFNALFSKVQLLNGGNLGSNQKHLLQLKTHSLFSTRPLAVKQQIVMKLGTVYFMQGKLQDAEREYLLAERLARQANDAPALYNSLDNLAAVYINTERRQQAIECLQQATTVKEKSGNGQDLGKGLLQLAGVFFTIENFEAGKRELQKAEDCIRKYKQQQFYPHLYFAKGMQLKREEKITEALQAYNTSIRYALLNKEWLMAVRAHTNKATILIAAHQWSRAEKDSLLALKLVKQHSIKIDALVIYTQLANISIERKNFLKAKHYIGLIKKEAQRYGNQMVLRDTEELTARLLEATNQPTQALQHYKKYIEHYRKFYDTELSRSVLDIQAKYETEKRERELQQAKLRQAESELKALRLQINPHFIFNTLSRIRQQLLEGNIEATDTQMINFARLLRLMLDTTRQPVMLLSSNIELLHLYIQAEQARQSKPFTYQLTIARGIKPSAIYIHGMLLQPLVENAILHGLFHKTGTTGQLNIHFAKAKQQLIVTITDNGIGRKKAAANKRAQHQSHATSIIRETLALLWKTENTDPYFIITDLHNTNGKPAGTSVKITLPLLYSLPVSNPQ